MHGESGDPLGAVVCLSLLAMEISLLAVTGNRLALSVTLAGLGGVVAATYLKGRPKERRRLRLADHVARPTPLPWFDRRFIPGAPSDCLVRSLEEYRRTLLYWTPELGDRGGVARGPALIGLGP
jgi:hypothetical protein